MKGHLVKRIEPADWVVWYTDSTAKNGLRIIPLHPDDAAGLFIQDTDTIYDGIEVEFEIVDEIIDLGRHGSTVVEKAKLVDKQTILI